MDPSQRGYGGQGSVQAEIEQGSLPFTGLDVKMLVAIGIILIATGVFFYLISRRGTGGSAL